MKLPFMYIAYDEDDHYNRRPEYYVVIASWDYTADREMSEDGPDGCIYNKKAWFKLGVSLIGNKWYKFDTQREQWEFVRQWWMKKT